MKEFKLFGTVHSCKKCDRTKERPKVFVEHKGKVYKISKPAKLYSLESITK